MLTSFPNYFIYEPKHFHVSNQTPKDGIYLDLISYSSSENIHLLVIYPVPVFSWKSSNFFHGKKCGIIHKVTHLSRLSRIKQIIPVCIEKKMTKDRSLRDPLEHLFPWIEILINLCPLSSIFKAATKSWREIIFVSASKIRENTVNILNYYISN